MEEIQGVTATPDSGASTAGDSPSPSIQGSGTPSEQSSATSQPPVQGQEPDIFADLPSVEELQQQAESGVKHAAALANLRGQIEPIRTEFSEFKSKFEPYQPVIERFEQPEQLQEVLNLYDQIVGWEQNGSELVPSTLKGAQFLAEKYPQHADFLAADLLNMPTRDPETGRVVPRIDLALEGMAKDPSERAKAAKILGLVEPSSISPQWQPTEEELSIIKPELQDVYKKLPYEEREELKLASPEFINRTLEREKFAQQLQADREAAEQRERVENERRTEYITQQARQAGEQYLGSLLTDKLTAFHNSVVESCNFLQPIDPQNPPQGMTADQVNQMNAQIAESNKAEASMISGLTIGVINEQTRPFVLPLLKEIGVIDDKTVKEIETASQGLGNNARNFGFLSYQGRLKANGNGYQPDASVTNLNNEAQRNLNKLNAIANQIKKSLMEKRSQFFSLKAQDHNQTLNNGAGLRPGVRGSAFDPSSAAPPPPQGWMSRDEINRRAGV